MELQKSTAETLTSLDLSMKRETLKCPICFDYFTKPRTLPCLHSFCQNCLQNVINNIAESRRIIFDFNCPVCRTVVKAPDRSKPVSEWASAYPLNFILESLLTPIPVDSSAIKCNPCEFEKKMKSADMFCIECKEYLCTKCTAAHRKMQLSRDHKVVTLEEINRNQKPEINETRIEGTLKKIQDTRSKIETVVSADEENLQRLQTQKEAIKQKVMESHQQLVGKLTHLKNSFLKELDDAFQRESTSISAHLDKCKRVIQDLQTSAKALQQVLGSEGGIELDETKLEPSKHIEELTEEINSKAKVRSVDLDFQLNNHIKILQNLKAFGAFLVTRSEKREEDPKGEQVEAAEIRKYAVVDEEYDISLPDDEAHCWITGMVYLPGIGTVLVDMNNNKVKLFDSLYSFVSSLVLPGAYDVAVVGSSEIAVTQSHAREIHFISVEDNGELMPRRSFSTERKCLGIVFRNDQLFVTCDARTENPVLQIIGLSGEVIATLEKDVDGKNFFREPLTLTSNVEGDVFYVSDAGRGIVALDIDGNVKFVYRDVKRPYGISVINDGSVLICGYKSNDVQLLSTDGRHVRTLLTQADEIDRPLSLCYKGDEGSFVITYDLNSSKRNRVTKFKLQ